MTDKNIKILLIGFGSIGKRHYEVLNSLSVVNEISIVTKQELLFANTYSNIREVPNLEEFEYYIIANETSKHFGSLDLLCSLVDNKTILVEKPLFDKCNNIDVRSNSVFVAYNLRFHPVISKLKTLLNSEQVYYANIICGQYLPTWRPGTDYRESYSADINKGGGVLRDLSHELDYSSWLFGDFTPSKYINTKISDLEISSDDLFVLISKTIENTIVNLSIDYISKSPIRKLIIHTSNKSLEADVVRNVISITDKDGTNEVIELGKIDRNYSYLKMHEAVIGKDYSLLCTLIEGKKIVSLIDDVNFLKD